MRRTFRLDDRAAAGLLRGALFLALLLLLVHSPRQAASFQWTPFALAAGYLLASAALWAGGRRAETEAIQTAAFLADVAVVCAVLSYSAGFEPELFLAYFAVLFMAALTSRPQQGFLVGAFAGLCYAALWSWGAAAAGAPLVSLLLRVALLGAAAYLAAFTVERARARARRRRLLELRLLYGRLANGGWGAGLEEDLDGLDPQLAKTVRTVNSLIDNLAGALKRTVAQNEALREEASRALLQLEHERERLGAVERSRPDGAARPPE